MHYELTDLRIFLVLARTLGLAAAAEDVHRTPSAVSLRLKKLEEALGIELFVRTPRGLELTAAGASLVPRAEEVLAAASRLEAAAGGFRAGRRETLRVAANSSGIQNHLAPAAGAFLAESGARLVFLERISSEAVEDVVKKRADLAFCLESAARTAALEADLEIVPFTIDRHVLVAPHGHPLSGRESVRLADILDYPYIGLSDTAPMTRAMKARAKAIERRYEPVVVMPSFRFVIDLAASGAGAAVVPRSALRPRTDLERLAVVRIEEHWALRPLVFVHAKHPEKAETIAAFVEACRGAQQEAH